jgi:hypothetical protein
MKRRPFEVGERVAARFHIGRPDEVRCIGEVVRLLDFENVQVRILRGSAPALFPVCHPKQLRRLKQPRRVWAWLPPGEHRPDCWSMAWGSREAAENEKGDYRKNCELVCFVERLPKKPKGRT